MSTNWRGPCSTACKACCSPPMRPSSRSPHGRSTLRPTKRRAPRSPCDRSTPSRKRYFAMLDLTTTLATAVPECPACPDCGKRGTLYAATTLGAPSPGDLVVCLDCDAWQVVTASLQLRAFTLVDVDECDLIGVAETVVQIRILRDRRSYPC